MKPKTMILLVVAVGCGLAASFMTARLIADRNGDGNQEAKVRVLVAKKRINPWTLLDKPEVHFVHKEIPESAVPKKALKEFSDLKDKRLNKVVSEETFVTTDDLVGKDLDGLEGQLPKGYRAVAIRVTPESLAGGFVRQGSKVDVIATLREGRTRVKTIMQNMLVLAIDMAKDRNPDSPASLGTTATLAVKPEEAQRLQLASALGELRLSLRPLGEEESHRIGETTSDHFDRGLREGGSNSSDGSDTQLAGGGTLPTIPPLPPVPANIEAPKPDEKPVDEKPVRKHYMKLIIGENSQVVTFLHDGESWINGAAQGDDPKVGRKPLAPPPPGKPAAPGKKPVDQPVPEDAGAGKNL